MPASRATVAVVVLTTAVALAGCGKSDDKSPASGSSQSSAAPAAAGIDACKLISAEDITKLLGKPIDGKPLGADPEMPACTWENRDTYESVTVEIGNPGTAINGTLAPPEPGPDGMRFLASGMVEFPAGGRSNTVQVAVLALMGQDADNAAVDLAHKIGGQLPQ
jgi:hypothetical protein